MSISQMLRMPGWAAPVFKVLANNDTGNAPGHQAGFLVPKDLRPYFPPLSGCVTPSCPTLDHRITAELFDGSSFLGEVDTRYQYQTWGGERSPEARVTDQLGPLLSRARGGDILVMFRSLTRPDHYRFVLVRQSSADFPPLARLAAGRSWGALSMQ